ncbi:transposase, partial [Paracoccus liaowanqingii]|uniref:transposase n=1 Tax=Paracoccus liaowanqingii TaxID=2560053 RepID=UPI001F11859F
MKPRPRAEEQDDLLRPRLTEMIDLRHELAKLAALIDWEFFETEWAGFFPSPTGRPATSPRLVAGLLYLQHAYRLSDEAVVARWVENPYYRVPRSRRVRADVTMSMMGVEASRSRPAGAGFKPLHAAASKRRGGERWRKGGARRRQVSDEKMSASEPLMTHRKGFRSCQNGREGSDARTSVDATCLR